MLALFAPLLLSLAVGQRAPDFTLHDANGKAVKLSADAGHKVVLVFYRGYW
jgi:peroxiredoxin